jgi:hypothetical protein
MRASRTPSVIGTMTSLSITIIAREFLLEGNVRSVTAAEEGGATKLGWMRRLHGFKQSRRVEQSWSPTPGSCLARAGTGGVVLIVANVFTPVGSDVLVVDFVEREVNHQPGGGGAVPVLLVGLDVDAVARADHFDRAAAALDQSDPLGDEEALSKGVTVPGQCVRPA